jgi:hypothetical protein
MSELIPIFPNERSSALLEPIMHQWLTGLEASTFTTPALVPHLNENWFTQITISGSKRNGSEAKMEFQSTSSLT